MRRKGFGFAGVILTGILSYAIPKCLEVYGVMTSESYWLPYGIFIAIILFLGIAIWVYWPDRRNIETKKGVNRMVLNIGLCFGVFGIICIIVSAILILPRLSTPIKDVRIPLQVQLDTLINDLTVYKKTIPPHPIQNTNESWDDYTQRLIANGDSVNVDLVKNFSARIIDTATKLRDFHIISDSELQEDQHFVTPTATYASFYVGPGVLYKLCQNEADLDAYVEKWNIGKSNIP